MQNIHKETKTLEFQRFCRTIIIGTGNVKDTFDTGRRNYFSYRCEVDEDKTVVRFYGVYFTEYTEHSALSIKYNLNLKKNETPIMYNVETNTISSDRLMKTVVSPHGHEMLFSECIPLIFPVNVPTVQFTKGSSKA